MSVLGMCARSRLEIMEQMAVLQETAYEQLYRWAQSEYCTRLPSAAWWQLTVDQQYVHNLIKSQFHSLAIDLLFFLYF